MNDRFNRVGLTRDSLVADFWEQASCGEELLLPDSSVSGYQAQMDERYRLEPYIPSFIGAERWRGKRVLEIGVGMGADHQLFAENGALLWGLDITTRAIEHTRRRFELLGLESRLQVGDAQYLPFADKSFDCVYSYGVIHHVPDTPKAAREVLRVLKPGGTFKVMVYHRWSLVGLMLLARYGLQTRSLSRTYSERMESPGTKAYTTHQASKLFAGASDVQTRVELTHGDLLTSGAGQRHEGPLLTFARRVWPRWALKRVAKNLGTHLLVEGRAP